MKRKIPKKATTSTMREEHTAEAVVGTKDVVAVTITHMAVDMETTITVVVVPAMAVEETILAAVEAVYPSRLTRPNLFVTGVG